MNKIFTRILFYFCAGLSCLFMAFNTGCVSGGFKLTRQYAGWLNSQNIFIRIILYIVASVIFAVTLLIDVVLFNTMDFWEGRVSAGDYEFRQDNKVYMVKHQYLPGSNFRQSSIKVFDNNMSLQHEITLTELANGNVQVLADGQLREVGINQISKATLSQQTWIQNKFDNYQLYQTKTSPYIIAFENH